VDVLRADPTVLLWPARCWTVVDKARVDFADAGLTWFGMG